MPFSFNMTKLPGVQIIQPKIFPDDRGFFMETYKYSDFASHGIKEYFNQDNHSYSTKGILRGIHFQKEPHAQGKLVSVIEGTIWDMAVDLRPDSPNFKEWTGIELDSNKGTMFYIPPGFGHGFVVLSDTAHFLYKCTAEYNPHSDAGIRWDDPDLDIDWPIKDVSLSDKDVNLPLLRNQK